MKDATPQPVFLRDYTPFGFVIEETSLHFLLHFSATEVTSRIRFAPNPKAKDSRFFLHGENLHLKSAKIDGQEVEVRVLPDGIEVDVPDQPFTWEAVVVINPSANTALEGLY